jgi:hypothetical protein
MSRTYQQHQKKVVDPKVQFDDMLSDYLVKARANALRPKPYQSYELEVSFGNRRPITRTDYENVISQLVRNGWHTHNMEGDEMLRINSEFITGNANAHIVQDNNNPFVVKATTAAPTSTIPIPGKNNKFNIEEQMELKRLIDGPNSEYINPSENPNNITRFLRGGGKDYDGNYDEDDNDNHDKDIVVKSTPEDDALAAPQKGQRKIRMSTTFRLEINGAKLIEMYCRHDSLDVFQNLSGLNSQIKFTDKKRVERHDDRTTFYDNASFPDHNCRVAYKFEWDYRLDSQSEKVRSTLRNWSNSKKTYRCMNRVRFKHPSIPIYVDVSVIKTNSKDSNGRNGKPVILPTYTMKSANVFNNQPHYEIELEMNNYAIQNNEIYKTSSKDEIMAKVRLAIRHVLSGLQDTPYPVSYSEQELMYKEYMDLIHGEEIDTNDDDNDEDETTDEDVNPKQKQRPNQKKRRKFPVSSDFAIPQPVTLQQKHLLPDQPHNICTDYMVTEKADGQRALLYVTKTGKLFMIKSNMKFIFTGAITKEPKCFNSLLDGEFILYGKHKQLLFLFAAFDIYYIGSRKDPHVRPLPLYHTNDDDDDDGNDGNDGNDADNTDKPPKHVEYRLTLLRSFVDMLDLQSITENTDKSCVLRVQVKQFVTEPNIFNACRTLITQKDSYEYETDGLIFTPMNTGVGSNRPFSACDPVKSTWELAYKWKPPQYNTIDFYVVTVKDKHKDVVKHIIHDSNDTMSKAVAYKVVHLHVGSTRKIESEFQSDVFSRVLEDKIGVNEITQIQPNGYDTNNQENSLIPVPFKPTTPHDPNAYVCYIPLDDQMRMCTVPVEDDAQPEEFDDFTIVEFSYAKDDSSKEGPWKWIPIRVRHDKTESLRNTTSKHRDFGNFIHTANSNWLSIHTPVTNDMIIGNEDIIPSVTEDTVYYDIREKNSKLTRNLRDFHNKFIKSKLIRGVSRFLQDSGNIEDVHLIDYSVGRGGDIYKWKESNIKFVLGIDVSKDNVISGKDNASLRYLKLRRDNGTRMKLRALFLPGNSSRNIRTNANAFQDTLHKQLVHSIFGKGTPLPAQSDYVFRHGIAREGFHISSCQFSLHYFMETTQTMHQFLRNLSECTRLNGFFIGTCYDGQSVFDVLKNPDGVFRVEKNKRVLCNIKKQYSQVLTTFPNDETSLGMRIDVYQESIGHVFPEYLVSFQYFTRMMENYGFAPITESEWKAMQLPGANGLFHRMYTTMESDIGLNFSMTPEEKAISFLNRFFVFKKMRDIPTATLENMAETLEHHADSTADAIANDDKQDKQDKQDKKKTRACKKTSKKRIQLEEDPDFVQDDNTRNKDDKPKK